MPYLIFCIDVLSNPCINSLQPLFILQKWAIKSIHNSALQAHPNLLLLKSNLFKLHDIYIQSKKQPITMCYLENVFGTRGKILFKRKIKL